MKKSVKKMVVILMTTMLLVMQVMTASAVTVTAEAVDWKLKQAVWDLRNYDSQMAPGVIKYTCSGGTTNATTMDSGHVKMIIMRAASTNIVVEYDYDTEFSSYVEDHIVSGDYTQLGESYCYVDLVDNFYGTISEVIINRN